MNAWTYTTTEEGGFLGSCEHLGLIVFGETRDVLTENIAETVAAIVDDLSASGEIEQFLESHGWNNTDEIPRA